MKSKTLFYLFLLTLVTSLIPAMHAQTFSVIHSFTGGPGGLGPRAGVTIRGNELYGTTSSDGTVYRLTHSGSNWLYSPIAPFPYCCQTVSGVVFGPDGHLYGTKFEGGKYNGGAVFKLTPPVGICRTAACYWTVNDLYDFGLGTDGSGPGSGDLIWDQQGNIYGTTIYGGYDHFGTVYELTPSGNGYTESVIQSFSDFDGAYPESGLVFDNNGNLFGTTFQGGSNDQGVVFELSYAEGVWTENVLYRFQNASDGENPFGGLIFDSAGNFYGTTSGGCCGGASVFELSPVGDTWGFTLLYSLPGYECGPYANLAFGPDGALYGTTYCGGTYNYGSVFKLSNTQNGWAYTSLYDFTGGSDGAYPLSNVTFDADGNLYGTASMGGLQGGYCANYNGCGVVWMIKP